MLNEAIIHFINAFATGAAFSVLLYNILYALSGKKLKLWLFTAVMYAADVIICFVAENYLPVILFLTSVVFMHLSKVKLTQNIISNIIGIALFFFAIISIDFIVATTVVNQYDSVEVMRNSIFFNTHNTVMFSTMIMILSLIIRKLSRYVHRIRGIADTDYSLNFIYFIAIGVLLYISVISTFWLMDYNEAYLQYNIILDIAFVLFAGLSIYTILHLVTKKTKELEAEKNREITAVYKNEIQNMYDEIRDFKHDYMKIYSSMSTMLKEGKYDELTAFFDNEITPMQTALETETSFTHSIVHIIDSVIQGLVYSYIIRARNDGIDFIINIDEDIHTTNKVSSVDLVRVLGILLDNAFEAALLSDSKTVRMGIITNDNMVMYAIKNSYLEKPNISKMFDTNYSSKGDKRGRGLAIAKKICDKNKYLNLNVKLENIYCIAEVIINK